jgi:hypothetical protein
MMRLPTYHARRTPRMPTIAPPNPPHRLSPVTSHPSPIKTIKTMIKIMLTTWSTLFAMLTAAMHLVPAGLQQSKVPGTGSEQQGSEQCLDQSSKDQSKDQSRIRAARNRIRPGTGSEQQPHGSEQQPQDQSSNHRIRAGSEQQPHSNHTNRIRAATTWNRIRAATTRVRHRTGRDA